VEKRYWVLVKGRVDRARRVDRPLVKGVSRSGERMVEVSREGRASRTDFRPVACDLRCSLLEALPRTGRTHQIRVHAADLRMPLAGDEKYGDYSFNRLMRSFGLKRLFLHAASIAIRTGEGWMEFDAPLAPELAAVLVSLGLGADPTCR